MIKTVPPPLETYSIVLRNYAAKHQRSISFFFYDDKVDTRWIPINGVWAQTLFLKHENHARAVFHGPQHVKWGGVKDWKDETETWLSRCWWADPWDEGSPPELADLSTAEHYMVSYIYSQGKPIITTNEQNPNMYTDYRLQRNAICEASGISGEYEWMNVCHKLIDRGIIKRVSDPKYRASSYYVLSDKTKKSLDNRLESKER